MENNIVSITSTRSDGSMKNNRVFNTENIRKFLSANDISLERTHFMHQVHGNAVEVITNKSAQILSGIDGMVTRDANVFLGVVTADCLPVLLADEESGVIGVAHAGYKGILAGVIENLITAARKLGAYPEDMYISIGPSIGVCCYNVDEERVKRFTQIFSTDRIFRFTDDKVYLDLKKAAVLQLEKEGIAKDKITVSTDCTSCKKDKFFSYRADSTETFGEMLTIIGRKT